MRMIDQPSANCKKFANLQSPCEHRWQSGCRAYSTPDVAARAGVSEATVSRVMNGKDGGRDRTRSHVVSVLAELGYEPT